MAEFKYFLSVLSILVLSLAAHLSNASENAGIEQGWGLQLSGDTDSYYFQVGEDWVHKPYPFLLRAVLDYKDGIELLRNYLHNSFVPMHFAWQTVSNHFLWLVQAATVVAIARKSGVPTFSNRQWLGVAAGINVLTNIVSNSWYSLNDTNRDCANVWLDNEILRAQIKVRVCLDPGHYPNARVEIIKTLPQSGIVLSGKPEWSAWDELLKNMDTFGIKSVVYESDGADINIQRERDKSDSGVEHCTITLDFGDHSGFLSVLENDLVNSEVVENEDHFSLLDSKIIHSLFDNQNHCITGDELSVRELGLGSNTDADTSMIHLGFRKMPYNRHKNLWVSLNPLLFMVNGPNYSIVLSHEPVTYSKYQQWQQSLTPNMAALVSDSIEAMPRIMFQAALGGVMQRGANYFWPQSASQTTSVSQHREAINKRQVRFILPGSVNKNSKPTGSKKFKVGTTQRLKNKAPEMSVPISNYFYRKTGPLTEEGLTRVKDLIPGFRPEIRSTEEARNFLMHKVKRSSYKFITFYNVNKSDFIIAFLNNEKEFRAFVPVKSGVRTQDEKIQHIRWLVVRSQTEKSINDGSEMVPLTIKKLEEAVEEKRWYHGNISDEEAESRLRRGCGGKDGTYLVYDSPEHEGEYRIFIYNKRDVQKLTITKRFTPKIGDQYNLSGHEQWHETLKELIKYHRGLTGTPLELENGSRVRLSEHVYLK
ncbi:MAG: SH2 domain-containing protein [Endozoicomonas sp.]|uniref:SH2 domain-containing protein n=1 Tax=Endozoicomonas sp. TaxID=1892382 RepID=UPI003D9BBD7E